MRIVYKYFLKLKNKKKADVADSHIGVMSQQTMKKKGKKGEGRENKIK